MGAIHSNSCCKLGDKLDTPHEAVFVKADPVLEEREAQLAAQHGDLFTLRQWAAQHGWSDGGYGTIDDFQAHHDEPIVPDHVVKAVQSGQSLDELDAHHRRKWRGIENQEKFAEVFDLEERYRRGDCTTLAGINRACGIDLCDAEEFEENEERMSKSKDRYPAVEPERRYKLYRYK